MSRAISLGQASVFERTREDVNLASASFTPGQIQVRGWVRVLPPGPSATRVRFVGSIVCVREVIKSVCIHEGIGSVYGREPD